MRQGIVKNKHFAVLSKMSDTFENQASQPCFLIINNLYDPRNLDNPKDLKRLNDITKNLNSVKIEEARNDPNKIFTKDNIDEIVKNYLKQDMTNFSCFICIIIGYTIKNKFKTAKNSNLGALKVKTEIDVENLFNIADTCDSLKNKPKIFLFQGFCDNESMSERMDSDTSSFQEASIPFRVIIKQDFIVGYSAIFGNRKNVNYLHREGSLFFKELSELLVANNQKKYDISTLMTKLNRNILNDPSNTNGIEEISCFISSLKQDFILYF